MDTYGSVRRHMVGLTLSDSSIPAKGSKLYAGDREVGWVSSAVYSPQLNAVIALGFPLRDFSKPRTELSVEIEGKQYKTTVTSLPFYTRG